MNEPAIYILTVEERRRHQLCDAEAACAIYLENNKYVIQC